MLRDPYEHVHPDTLERYYGSNEGDDRDQRHNQLSPGLSDSASEDGSTTTTPQDPNFLLEELENQIEGDQDHHIRHKPIAVARHRNPFTVEEEERHFTDILAEVSRRGIIPPHYGVQPNEWDSDTYPLDIWYPRAVLWAQGLEVLRQLVEVDSIMSDTDSNSDVEPPSYPARLGEHKFSFKPPSLLPPPWAIRTARICLSHPMRRQFVSAATTSRALILSRSLILPSWYHRIAQRAPTAEVLREIK